MKSAIFLLLFSAIFLGDGVQLNINPSTLALSFQRLPDYTQYWQSMWTGYDVAKNRIYLFGGDRGGSGQVYPIVPKGVYYDITNNVFVDYPLNTPDHFAQTQDFTQVGSKMYRIETNKLFIFDMATETPSQKTITTPSSVKTISNFVDHIALCTDGDRYLYAVGYNQLYIYDVFNLNTPIQGPNLVDGKRQHHSCAYVNGAVYVIGGFSESNRDIKTIEKAVINVDNPGTMSFSNYKNIGAIRWGHRNLVIGNYVYIIGGSKMGFGACCTGGANAVRNVDILDTTNANFYTKTNLVESRFFHGQAMDANGKIYVFGGARTTKTNEPLKLKKTNEKSSIGINGNCENPLRNTRRRLPAISSGDPHYTTFNGRRYDFQGKGCYYYMATCPGVAYSLPFALRAQHFKCNSVARCILELYIDIFGSDGSTIIETIDVRRSGAERGIFKTYNTNGLVADFYASPFNGGKRNFRLQSQFAKDTGCGYDFEIIAWIGGHINVHVADSQCYVCESCGMYGYVNADGNRAFDMVKGDELGTLTTNVNEFGYSWYYGDKCTGPPLGPGETHTTEAPVDVFDGCDTAAVNAACNALYTEGEFAACCKGWSECTAEIENCKFDTCANLFDDPTQNVVDVVDDYGRPSLEFLCARPDAPNNVVKSCVNPARAGGRRRLPAIESGDPHYRTFDGTTHHFQGSGCYYYVTQCPTVTTHVPFALRAVHWQCNGRARCVGNAFVDIIGTDGTIIETVDIENDLPTQDIVKNINSNGIVGTYTLSKFVGGSRTFELNTNIKPSANCGPDIKFNAKFIPYNGDKYVAFYVYDPDCYKCETCGLFGFFSGKAADDFVLGPSDKTYVQVSNDVNTHGYSWYYGKDCYGDPDPDGIVPEEPYVSICDSDPNVKQRITEKCTNLFHVEFKQCCDSNPDFAGCDEGQLFSCIFDTCATITENEAGDTSDAAIDAAIDAIARKDLEFICATPEAPTTIIDECTNDFRGGANRRRMPPIEHGDPHYTTFEGVKYDFQGAGCYYYLTDCPTVQTQLSFAVRAQHWKCNSVARCINNVYVDILAPDGSVIVTVDIKKDIATQTNVNQNGLTGRYTLSAYTGASRMFELFTDLSPSEACGSDLKFKTTFVPYNAGVYVNLYIYDPKCYKCEVCGLFGFYSDVNTDDFILGASSRDDVVTSTNRNEFGYSWFYGDDCEQGPNPIGPTEKPVDVIGECSRLGAKTLVQTECNNLFNVEFDACCNTDPDFDGCDELFDSCVFDTCAALLSDADGVLTVKEAVDLFARPDVEFLCDTDPEAPVIDCEWSVFSAWSTCTVECGGGTQQRSRTEAVRASGGGAECTGGATETQDCNTDACVPVVDCVWNAFSVWSTCSVTCGGGTQIRVRTEAVPASGGGAECTGSTTESRPCNTQACVPVVDCEWSVWGVWSTCSTACGGGTQQRSRFEAVSASGGGAECTGVSTETRDCNTQACVVDIDCEWSVWGAWSTCTADCNGGTQQRSRFEAVSAAGAGAECVGGAIESRQCNSQACITPAPTFEPCTNDDITYNAQFILDESGSVNRFSEVNNYEKSVQFVIDLVLNDINSVAKVAAMAFSTHNDRIYSFSQSQTDGRNGIIAALQTEVTDYAKLYTDTYNALKEGLREFVDTASITAQQENLLFLITDGEPWCAPGGGDPGCTEDVCGQADLLAELKAYNIRIITIGITAGFIDNKDKLKCLSAPEDVFLLVDFSSTEFKRIETQLREILCPETAGAGEDFPVFSIGGPDNGEVGLFSSGYLVSSVFISAVTTLCMVSLFYACFHYLVLNKNMRGFQKYAKVYKEEI